MPEISTRMSKVRGDAAGGMLGRREVVELQRLEDVIRTAHSWALLEAQSLRTIRNKRLYRASHDSFEAYTEERWKMSRAHAYRLVSWADAVDAVSPVGDGGPTTERAARPLYGLTPPQQRRAWKAFVRADEQGNQSLIATCEAVRADVRLRADKRALKSPGGDAEVICADVFEGLKQVTEGSISLMLTSPPYAEQRDGQYPGVHEREYPRWMTNVMAALQPKLRLDASVLLVLRPHVEDGQISDYVLRTRLSLRDAGWIECEELIWHKTDSPPLGSKLRPRRAWESVLWFSRVRQPFVDLLANGRASNRIGYRLPRRQGVGGDRAPIRIHHDEDSGVGMARTTDVLAAGVSEIEDGVEHPAVMPTSLAEQLIRTFTREGDLVADVFSGSGTTLVAARRLGRECVGIEAVPRYAALSRRRLQKIGKPRSALGVDQETSDL